MTTHEQQEAIKRTADQLAEAAYVALSNVARSLADGDGITPVELPALIVRFGHIRALVEQAEEMAVRMSNSASWAERAERAS